MFNEVKTAQMAAYLLSKSGGNMRYIKLMKLLYLADRESMRRTGDSMTHDRFFSLKNGPILSRTLNLLRGMEQSREWSAFIERRNYESKLAAPVSSEDLDELSPLNLAILDQIYADHGWRDWRNLVDWTHDHCAEWTDPGLSCLPIAPRQIFEAVGCEPEQARELESQYSDQRKLEQLWSSYN